MRRAGSMADTTLQSFLDAAAALAPVVQASAVESERSRRLPTPLVEAMARSGLFRLWIPRGIGGEESDPMTLVRVVEEISRADGAAGWCMAIAGGYGVFGGYLQKEAALEIYGSDPLVRAAGCDRRATQSSSMVVTALQADGHSEAAASTPPGSWAAAGFWTGINLALRLTAPQSRASCIFPPRSAKSSILGTVSGFVARAAMTMRSRMFSCQLIAPFRFANPQWSKGRFMRFRQSQSSVLCSQPCRWASPATRSTSWSSLREPSSLPALESCSVRM